MTAAAQQTTEKWKYVGVASDGHTKEKGNIEAASREQAISKITAMGLIPIDLVNESSESIMNKDLSIKRKNKMPSTADLATMARQLATMVTAGVSIVKSLEIISAQISNARLESAIVESIASVQAGNSFSASMKAHPEIFPPIMINMVEAGETGGFLDEALATVADSFEADLRLKRQVKSAITYPVIVLVFAAIIVSVVILVVVPKFEEIFSQLDATLPIQTQILIGMSKAAPFTFPIFFAALIAFAVFWQKNKHTDKVRSWWDPLKLKLPVFGRLNNIVALSRFCKNFAAMLSSGVPILQALDIVGATSGNKVYEDATKAVSKNVEQGYRLSDAIAQQEVFPNMVVQMIRVGEDSGEIDKMLTNAGESYGEEAETISKQLSSLLEPLMIMILGIVVGLIVIALYSPMFSMYDKIK